MKKLNLFISFEGGEGTGKTTISKLVKEELEKRGEEVFLTREPGGNGLEFAEKIRELIMNHSDIDPITELLLFNASRREHILKKIKPELERGKIVISDRFEDSTIVYQGVAKGVDEKMIREINKITVQDFSPSLVFIFNLNPKFGLSRISDNEDRIEKNRFDEENFKFHKKIQKGYLNLKKTNKDKYIVVDALKPMNEITKFIIDKLYEYENKINKKSRN
ncbi:MAG: thymidylate kinase [Candidatus Tyloplasma litorale]|nr:MAG: thymidylate kinase [Mycoplasmatales bacterium]